MEANELKAGSTKTYQIGDKVLTLKPVTLGKMKKAMMAFKKQDGDAFDMMRDHLVEILGNGSNDFATKDWIEENMTMPLSNEIINDMRIINGMGQQDVFQLGGDQKPTMKEKNLVG